MRPFDYDMVQILHKELIDNGVNLIVNDKVEKFEKDTVVLESGKKNSCRSYSNGHRCKSRNNFSWKKLV